MALIKKRSYFEGNKGASRDIGSSLEVDAGEVGTDEVLNLCFSTWNIANLSKTINGVASFCMQKERGD